MATEKQVYDALIGVGFNRSQAAGIMGNLQNESNFDQEVINPGGPQAGVGLAQWETTFYPAAAGYVTGNASRDLTTQVKAILSAARGLNLGGSAEQVAGTWASQFERCKGCEPGGAQYNARVANANRIYQQAKTGKWPAPSGGGVSGSGHGGGGGSGGGGGQAELTSFLSPTSPSGGVLQDAGALLHGTAVVLDRAFGLFAPGQGWRAVFFGIAGVSGVGAYKTYTSDRGETDTQLPLAIALLGVACVALFMAARPWPQTGAGPIKPGAYVVDVLEGRPPPSGPETFSPTEVHLTEAGLATLLALWAAGKIGQSTAGIAAGAAAGGGLLGKMWGWIKGLGGEASGGGEVPAIPEVP